MRNIFAVFISLAAFTATVALVNSFGTTSELPFSFDIQSAAERLAILIGQPLEALAAERDLPLLDQGRTSVMIGAFGLSLPAVFAFLLFGR